MRWRIFTVIIATLLALDLYTAWILLGEPYVGIYNAANAGIFLSTQTSCKTIIGYEWKGTPGFFSGGVC